MSTSLLNHRFGVRGYQHVKTAYQSSLREPTTQRV